MNFIVLGTSEFTICCARGLMDSSAKVSALVSMPSESRPDNSADLAGFAEQNGISYEQVTDINAEDCLDLLRGYSPDYLFSTWPKILKTEALSVPRYFTVGSHPTELPHNRGRHPIHWLISQGIRQSYLSFFRMDEGVDSGNILLQVPYEVSDKAVIGDLNALVNEAAYKGTKSLAAQLQKEPDFPGEAQDQDKANYWRKRTPHDITLDLRMPSDAIFRTVRSYSPPYPCAKLVFEDAVIRVVEASVSKHNEGLTAAEIQRLEPGRVLAAGGNTLSVKTDDLIIDLECDPALPARLQKTKYVHPPAYYLAKRPNLAGEIERNSA